MPKVASHQGCCLTGARSPGAPKLCMRATKFLYKEPARAPINLRLSRDNGLYFPLNLILLAELQTMELFLYLAWSHTLKNFSQFCNENVQQRRFAKPSFVSCWQLETGYNMWFPNMEYQNHGLFFAGDHALAATKNCYVNLIYIFSFCEKNG